MECTAEGKACVHSGEPFMLLRHTKVAKALFENMKYKLSGHLRWNFCAWAITPLRFSPPTFIEGLSDSIATHTTSALSNGAI